MTAFKREYTFIRRYFFFVCRARVYLYVYIRTLYVYNIIKKLVHDIEKCVVVSDRSAVAR